MDNKTSKLINVLERAGLNQKEAQIYLSVLQLGGGKASEIANLAKNERSNTYYILHRLAKMGFCSVSEKNNIQYFVAAKPDTIYRRFMERGEELKDAINELKLIAQSDKNRPAISQYQGRKGILQIYDDVVDTMLLLPKEKREVLSYLSADVAFSMLKREQQNFMKRCKRNRIRFRWICPNTEFAREYIEPMAEDYYYDIRLVSEKQFRAETEVDIYSDKVAYIGINDLRIGTIINHQQIAETQRELFELAWKGAESYRGQD